MNTKSFSKFENFLSAFGATRVLLQQAHEKGALIEGVVLYTALVDGFCRICLILKEQLENKNGDINEKYIYQNDDESNYSEREIYSIALKKDIIDSKIFEEINKLYNIRNKIIHRFFISEVEYSHMEIVCKRYEIIYNKLWNITYDLEAEQIDKGVGMTISGKKITKKDEVVVHTEVMRKIKSGSERNLAKTLDSTSVEEIMEFAQEKGLLQMCVCGHPKVHHIDLKILKKKNSTEINDGLVKCSAKNCSCTVFAEQEIEADV